MYEFILFKTVHEKATYKYATTGWNYDLKTLYVQLSSDEV